MGTDCKTLFFGRGWTGTACGECSDNFYPLRGECQPMTHPVAPPPPRIPAAFIVPPPPPVEVVGVTWTTLALAVGVAGGA